MSPTTRPSAPPVRTCVGCRQRRPQPELVRLRMDGDRVVLETGPARGAGRGAYLCAKMECWEAARRRRALGRALRLSGTIPDADAVGRALAGMISSSARAAPGHATATTAKEGTRSPS